MPPARILILRAAHAPAAEAGAMVAFAGLGTAAELVAVFADVVLGRAGERGKPDFRGDEIFDFGQGEHVALGAIAFRLNGRRLNRSYSKRKVIELAGAAQR